MSAHLRLIKTRARVYVVARTRLVRPGTPYVVAECAGDALVDAPPKAETFTRDDMLADYLLTEALLSWRAGDDSLFREERMEQERAAAAAMDDDRAARASRARALHPSSLSKHWVVERTGP